MSTLNFGEHVAWRAEGLRVEVVRRAHREPQHEFMLSVHNLNPQVETITTMSKDELIQLGWWLIGQGMKK